MCVNVLLVSVLAALSQHGMHDAVRLMRGCITAREGISSGEVKLIQETVLYGHGGGKIVKRQRCHYHIVFDRENLRFARSAQGETKEYVLTADSFMKSDGNPEHGVRIGSRDSEEGHPGVFFRVFDPHIIGMTPALPSHWYVHRWRDFLNTEPNECNIYEEKIGDVQAKHICYARNHTVVDVWIAPDQGPSVIRADLSATKGGVPLVDSMTCSNKLHGESGVWFPEELVHRRTFNGEMVTEYTIRVTEARFNFVCDRTAFTLQGLAPEKGSYIRHDQAPISVWDGEKAVPVSHVMGVKEAGPDWLFWGAVAFFIVGIGLTLARIIRTKRFV